MSDVQIRIDTLRGELREEKEYATALEEGKRDAERLLSKKIEELCAARKEIDQLRRALSEPQQEGRGEPWPEPVWFYRRRGDKAIAGWTQDGGVALLAECGAHPVYEHRRYIPNPAPVGAGTPNRHSAGQEPDSSSGSSASADPSRVKEAFAECLAAAKGDKAVELACLHLLDAAKNAALELQGEEGRCD